MRRTPGPLQLTLLEAGSIIGAGIARATTGDPALGLIVTFAAVLICRKSAG